VSQILAAKKLEQERTETCTFKLYLLYLEALLTRRPATRRSTPLLSVVPLTTPLLSRSSPLTQAATPPHTLPSCEPSLIPHRCQRASFQTLPAASSKKSRHCRPQPPAASRLRLGKRIKQLLKAGRRNLSWKELSWAGRLARLHLRGPGEELGAAGWSRDSSCSTYRAPLAYSWG